jgi:hypothetical protein
MVAVCRTDVLRFLSLHTAAEWIYKMQLLHDGRQNAGGWWLEGHAAATHHVVECED